MIYSRLIFADTDPETLNATKIPWGLLLRLSIAELAGFVLLPCTDAVLAALACPVRKNKNEADDVCGQTPDEYRLGGTIFEGGTRL